MTHEDRNIVRAALTDLTAVKALLREADLPLDGIEDQFPSAYAVARQGSEIVAVAGLERHGEFGLLRSVTVRRDARNRGLGILLVEDRLRAAESLGLSAVYLLTTTAPTFFERFGFAAAVRAHVPADVARSREFSSVCPASATCLARTTAGQGARYENEG